MLKKQFMINDRKGHVTEAEDALGNKDFLEYDEVGQLVCYADPNAEPGIYRPNASKLGIIDTDDIMVS